MRCVQRHISDSRVYAMRSSMFSTNATKDVPKKGSLRILEFVTENLTVVEVSDKVV